MSARDLAATVRVGLGGVRIADAFIALAELEQQAADIPALERQSKALLNGYAREARKAEARAVRAEEALRRIARGGEAGDDYTHIAREALAAAGADTE